MHSRQTFVKKRRKTKSKKPHCPKSPLAGCLIWQPHCWPPFRYNGDVSDHTFSVSNSPLPLPLCPLDPLTTPETCRNYSVNSFVVIVRKRFLINTNTQSAILFFRPCIFNNEDKNKPTKCTNQFWIIYYWSITPTCFDLSVEAIIREFETL